MSGGLEWAAQGRFPAQAVAQTVSICRVAEQEYDNFAHYEHLTAIASKAQSQLARDVSRSIADSRSSQPPPSPPPLPPGKSNAPPQLLCFPGAQRAPVPGAGHRHCTVFFARSIVSVLTCSFVKYVLFSYGCAGRTHSTCVLSLLSLSRAARPLHQPFDDVQKDIVLSS